ncbi:MAG: hypothetical protein NXI16_01270 [Alphaproteobacteria bacterium]|nr:hypothetical protein [Alphaproteobacteria bacterium]
MTINRAKIRRLLEPGLNEVMEQDYKVYDQEHKRLFDIEKSKRAFEEDLMMSGFGAAKVKAEGASISFDTAQEMWTARYNHETIALAFAISREAYEDNLYGALGKRYGKALSRSIHHTVQVKGAAIYNNAFDASVTYGDGVALLASNHPTLTGGTWSNVLSTPSDLNETALEDATIQMAAWIDERGLLVNIKPKGLHVHPSNHYVATRLLVTEKRPGTSDNDVNAIGYHGAIPEGHSVCNYFTDPDAWFIRTDAPNGMKCFERRAIEFGAEDSFDNEVYKHKGSIRLSFGASDPRGLMGSPGA